MTDSDLWGAAYNANHWLPNFFVVNEEPVVGRNSDGDPYFRASGNDRFFAIIAKMVDSVADKKLTFNSDVSELDKYKNTTDAFERPVDMFIGGNCLFTKRRTRLYPPNFGGWISITAYCPSRNTKKRRLALPITPE